MKSTIEGAIAAYNEAKDTWTGASWRHELKRNGAIVRADNGDPVYCEGEYPETCEYCAQVYDDATTANLAAGRAIDALTGDTTDWEKAESLAREAWSLEDEYGDAPTWGPFYKTIENLREIAERHIVVSYAPSDDLAEAGLCRCPECVETFAEAWEEALAMVANDRGLLDVEAKRIPSYASEMTRIGEEEPHVLHEGLWLAAHDCCGGHTVPAAAGSIYATDHAPKGN